MAKTKTTTTVRVPASKQTKKSVKVPGAKAPSSAKGPSTSVTRDSTAYFKFGTYFKKILLAQFGQEKSEKGRKTSSKEAISVLNTLTISMISYFRVSLKKIAMGSQRLTIMKDDVDTLAAIILTNDLVEKYRSYRVKYDDLTKKDAERKESEKDKFNADKAKLLIIPTARVEKTLRGKNHEQGKGLVLPDEGDSSLRQYLNEKEVSSQKGKEPAKDGKKASTFGFKVSSSAIISCTCLVRVLLDDILFRAGKIAESHQKVMIKVSHIYEALKANPSASLIFHTVMPSVVDAVDRERAARDAAKAKREGSKEKKSVVTKKKKEAKKAPAKAEKAAAE